MSDLILEAAAHLRQEAETRQRMGGFWTEDAYFRDAVAVLLEAIAAMQAANYTDWTLTYAVTDRAGAVAAVVVPKDNSNV